MKYTYIINTEDQTINVEIIGSIETTEMAALGLSILLKAKEIDFKIVFDCRKSRSKISIAEAYYWYNTHYDHIDIELRRIPTAYIANKDDWDFYSFFECTCSNKGILIKTFQEENAAMKWLECF